MGRLTAIDGATLVNRDLDVLEFGAKLRPAGDTRIDRVRISKPFEGRRPKDERISDLPWGTRHQSAAQFVFDQDDAMAIVASQDGKLSVFMRDLTNREKISVIEEAESLLL